VLRRRRHLRRGRLAQGRQLQVHRQSVLKATPDLGGAAIRALVQWRSRPAYITSDTSRGGMCSNGGALSSVDVNWDVINSLMINNKAIGFGASPAQSGAPGGGVAPSTDGGNYNVLIEGPLSARTAPAREDKQCGTLTIKDSRLHNSPSRECFTVDYPGIFFHSSGQPIFVDSTIS
jgi:hypothetical protein